MRRSPGWAAVLAAVLMAMACAGGVPGAGVGAEGAGGTEGPIGGEASVGQAGATPGSFARGPAGPLSDDPTVDNVVTTVIVVRHAEKAAGDAEDPRLSDAGRARSQALARALTDAGISAVITTQFVRTAETAAPTARAAGVTPEILPVRWDSVSRNAAAVAAQVRRHPGGVVLVVGHSNTVPDIVAALGAAKPPPICDSEYDRLAIVTLEASGQARLIESRYGAPTPAGAGCPSTD